jgi:siroheme synthase-like protein
MPHFPLFIDLNGQCCVIVGGGSVAERKLRSLLDFGACARVIAPAPVQGIRDLARENRVTLLERPYAGPEDLRNARRVIVAANSREVNRHAAEDAQNAGIPVNAADDPELCSFYFPALVRRGDIVAGISSSGACPGLAARLRRELDAVWPSSLKETLETLRTERRRLRATEVPDWRERLSRLIERIKTKSSSNDD